MKDVNLKNLKTTGVHTHSNKKPKENKPIIREKKSFSLGRKKDMIISDSSQENSPEKDKYQAMKKYLFNYFKVTKIHIYTIETHPFKATLVMGEPLENEALIMSYYANSNTEVLISALGVQSSTLKSRMVTQMHIENVDFRNYIGKNYLIVFDSLLLEAFKNKKDMYILMEYIHKCLAGKLKKEGVK